MGKGTLDAEDLLTPKGLAAVLILLAFLQIVGVQLYDIGLLVLGQFRVTVGVVLNTVLAILVLMGINK